jgi:chorismate mutase
MDRLNARLAALLQARARLALKVARAKARHGLAAADPARERAMLSKVLEDAPAGFPRRDLAALVRAVFAASRALVVRDRKRR